MVKVTIKFRLNFHYVKLIKDVIAFKFRIKELREKKGMTQEELAHKAGVTQPYIAQLENEFMAHNPRVKTLCAIATALETCPLALLQTKCKYCCKCDECDKTG